MKRVVLIVTGQSEYRALPESLRRLFPDVQFEAQHRDSFTSSALPPEPTLSPERPSVVEKLATALVAAVDPGRTGKPADLAMLIDDLELANASAADRAAHHVRLAVRAYIDQRWSNAERREVCSRLVRERCSFHLFAPMLEAYFFGEAAALKRAGAQRDPQLDPGRDLEDFEVTDGEYAAFCLQPVESKKGPKQRSMSPQMLARHPKEYLRYLCDPHGKSERPYKETKGGCEALRSLAWPEILTKTEQVRFVRGLLVDLASGLERDDLVQQWQGELHPVTSGQSPDRILRNL